MIHHLRWLPGAQTTPKLDFAHARAVTEQIAYVIDQRARECDETGIWRGCRNRRHSPMPRWTRANPSRRSGLVCLTRQISDTEAPTRYTVGYGRARSPGSTSPRVRERCVLIR